MNKTIYTFYALTISLLIIICCAFAVKLIYVNDKMLLNEKIKIENQQKLKKAEEIYKEKIFQLKVDILYVKLNCIESKDERTIEEVVFPCVASEQHYKNLETLKSMELNKQIYIEKIISNL